MNGKERLVSIIQVALASSLASLGVYMLMNSSLVTEGFTDFLGATLEPVEGYIQFDLWYMAFGIIVAFIAALTINYLSKRKSYSGDNAAKLFTGTVYLLAILTVLSFSLYPPVKNTIFKGLSSSLNFQLAMVMMSSVLVMHLVLRFTSLYDRTITSLKGRGLYKKQIEKCHFYSYGFTLMLGAVSLLLSLGIYYVSSSIQGFIEAPSLRPTSQTLVLVIIFSLCLVIIYYYLDEYLLRSDTQ